MNTEQLITVSMATVEQISQRVAREVAAQHPSMSEDSQAHVADQTTKVVIQVYCAELIAARLRQVELAFYDSTMSVASRIKALQERQS